MCVCDCNVTYYLNYDQSKLGKLVSNITVY